MKVKIIEDYLSFDRVNFVKEYKNMIKLGLASSFQDINNMIFYRVIAKNPKFIRPKNGLLIRNANLVCRGGDRFRFNGCDNEIKATHPSQESEDGHLLLKVKGVLDYPSKCLINCSCGTSFMIYADGIKGKPGECYLVIVTVSQPKQTSAPLRPFIMMDSIAAVKF